ncbi:MAG: hypothetical protein LBM98_08800 [Oscillospiraceae bacterium]|nr:hypothetical protein [Oscillospiraceae bacterium]
MLRTCNALRIAGLPVLRNDGLGFALAPAPLPLRNSFVLLPRNPRPNPTSLIFDI